LGPPGPLNRFLEVSDDVLSDRYYMYNKGIFSHIILLPCQTGCHEACIFVETSLSAPEWGETDCRNGDARKTSPFSSFARKKFRSGDRENVQNVKKWKQSFATDNNVRGSL
jgi:hypothetical protein